MIKRSMEKPEIPANLQVLTELRRVVLYRRQQAWQRNCQFLQKNCDESTVYETLAKEIADATEEVKRIRASITVTLSQE